MDRSRCRWWDVDLDGVQEATAHWLRGGGQYVVDDAAYCYRSSVVCLFASHERCTNDSTDRTAVGGTWTWVGFKDQPWIDCGGGTTSSTVTPPTTLFVAEPSAYEERPPPRGDFQNEEQLTETLATMSTSDLQEFGYTLRAEVRRSVQEFGYSLHDLVLDCKFAGSNCDPASVQRFNSFSSL